MIYGIYFKITLYTTNSASNFDFTNFNINLFNYFFNFRRSHNLSLTFPKTILFLNELY